MLDVGHEVLVLLPAVERFDGRGGAVATWAQKTYPFITGQFVIACPRQIPSFSGDLTIKTSRFFDFYLNSIEAAATSFIKFLPRLGKVIRSAGMRLAERMWPRLALTGISKDAVLHVHNRPRYALHAVRRGHRGPIFLHMHNDIASYITDAEALRIQDSNINLVYCSEYLRRKAQADFGFSGGSVVYNGITPNEKPFLRQQLPGRPFVLTFVGRLNAEKGPDRAVAIVDTLLDEGFDITLRIAGATGSGSSNFPTAYSESLKSEAMAVNNRFKSPRVELLGPLSHDEIFRNFETADVLLYPCRWDEPFGMVIIEAMSRGVIPVAPMRGGIPEIVGSGESGVLVDDDDDLGPYLEVLRSFFSTPHQVDKLRRGAVARAESRFGWERIACDLADVLRQNSRADSL
jgi:lipopolysaccharide exporter